MSVFHFLEFYATARWNNPKAEIESFLLSTYDYILAHLCAILEIVIRSRYPPDQYARFVTLRPVVGGTVAILGQAIRTSAMMQAGCNFNHHIEKQAREDHKLVVTGLYSWSRHPSYIGLYLLFVGAQAMVANYLVTILLACFLGIFLAKRIQCKSFFADIASLIG